MAYKLIIAGSRDWDSLSGAVQAAKSFNAYYKPGDSVEIVSGTAQGADKIGEQIAARWHIPVKQFPAEWEKHGKSAGYRRNEEMAKYADGCIVLWNGHSKGSNHMINLAKEYGLDLMIVTMNHDYIDPKDDLPWK